MTTLSKSILQGRDMEYEKKKEIYIHMPKACFEKKKKKKG
jgi:hypothetical protein